MSSRRSIQKNVRITPEENEEYERLKKTMKADQAMLMVLQDRFPLLEHRAMGVPVADVADVAPQLGTPVAVRRAPAKLPSGFKPDFKGKN